MRKILAFCVFELLQLFHVGLASPLPATVDEETETARPAGQFPLPIPCTGPAAASPPHTIDYQDFSVIQRMSDGSWFRFSKNNHTGQGLDVATSTNFSGPWYYSYSALSGPLLDPVAEDRRAAHLWVPDVQYWNGTYYMYYSIYASGRGKGKGFDIAVATSESMEEGSWIDHGSLGIPAPPNPGADEAVPYLRIGQSVLRNVTSPGTIDLQYNVMTYGDSRSGVYAVELADNLTSIKTDGRNSIIIADQYVNAKGALGGNKTGATFSLSSGQYIYLFYSVGACCARDDLPWDVGYHIEVCRTANDTGPYGEYFDRDGNNCLTGPVNRTGTVVQWSHSPQVYLPGSIGVTMDEQQRLVMYYQYRNQTASKTEGLRMGYNYLDFDDDDWPVLST